MDHALAAWGKPDVVGRLGGGNRNVVQEIRLGGQRLVARRSSRSGSAWTGKPPFSITWPAMACGSRTWLSGHQPGPRDWPGVAAALRSVHQLTTDWPQRPGFASTTELLTADRGGDVDLPKMPADAVTACRHAWARLEGVPHAVIHGDPDPANIRITGDGVGLLDWDEARVDCTDLDLAELPGRHLPPERLHIARTAAIAWEAANGWIVEPSYARRRLALLQAGHDNFG